MTKVFIIHGTGSTPDSNWFPWLKSELESLGCKVIVPIFPSPMGQNLQNWLKVLAPGDDRLEDCILIGHSLGPAFILNLLELTPHMVKAAFFVAGFVGLLNNEHFDSLNQTFVDKPFDWVRIKEHCKNFTVIQSKDDPYVPFERGEFLTQQLDGELVALENAGHINESAGFREFQQLLEKVRGFL